MNFKTSLALLLCLLGAPEAHAEQIEQLASIDPMPDGEMATTYGGFVMPNGLNINLGLEIISSIQASGLLDGDAFKVLTHFSTGPLGSTVPLPTTSVAMQNVANGVKIEHLDDGRTTIIQNALNNAQIDQVQKLTINIDNFTKIFPAAQVNAAMALRNQFIGQLPNGLH